MRRSAAQASQRMAANIISYINNNWPDQSRISHTELAQAGIQALAFAHRGLDDADADVQRISAETMSRIAEILSNQITGFTPRSRNGMDLRRAEAAKDINRASLNLKPLAQALAEQVTALAGHLDRSEASAQQAILGAIESVADICQFVGQIVQSADDSGMINWMYLPEGPEAKDANSAWKKNEEDVISPALIATVPAVARQLSSKDASVRLAALYVLETLGADAAPAAEPVANTAGDSDPFIRWAVARTLGKIAPRQPRFAVPALATLAKDPNGNARATALLALSRYGADAKSAVPALIEALTSWDEATRPLAAQALASIGPDGQPAVPALVRALTSTQADLRAAAATALGKIGPSAHGARDPLAKQLQDVDPEVRKAAAEAILRIDAKK